MEGRQHLQPHSQAGGFKEHIQPRYKFKTMPRTSKIESQYSIINALFKGINWLGFFFFYFKFSIRCCIIFHDLRKYIREEKEAINRTDESIFLTSEEILD